ncbi:virion structural protein [Acaryochloris phage A-HIS2]|nr:virion structural protein [Acaryochloris phage A-HIS2]
MTKTIIIDPGGIQSVREGINLRTDPFEYQESDLETSLARTSNAQLVAGGLKEKFVITWKALVNESDFNQLRRLIKFNTTQRSQGRTYETVIYNLFEPFSEVAAARTRFRVPATSNIEEDGPDTLGLTDFTYWVALQGYLEMTYERRGSCQLVTFTFNEGTSLTSDLET